MAHRILAEFGPPRGIVHLPAARMRYERFPKMDWARLQEDLTIQVHSIATLLQACLPKLRQSPLPDLPPKTPDARIVFVLSSVTLGLPPKYLTAYTVVKCALMGLMRSIAVEYAQVRINAISPSIVETQFLREIPAKAVEMAAGSHPLGRNAAVEDVCGLIAFLLSREADYIHGVNIPVTGGLIT
jgi:3-oxoacyl-[acyl-carrier protein] reductase